MTDFLNKGYELHFNNKFDDYMVKLKVGFPSRILENSVALVVEVTFDGDKYTNSHNIVTAEDGGR